MRSLTKKAILQGFQELLEEVPFDKITVSMLVKRCGIHHNTFYYHYQDIYQLLDEWMTQKLAQFSHERSTDSWEKNLKAFLQNCKKNQKIVKHIMNSLSREQRTTFLTAMYARRHREGASRRKRLRISPLSADMPSSVFFSNSAGIIWRKILMRALTG